MPIEHKPPTESTIRNLYYEADTCGNPSCSEPLILVDPSSGIRTLNSTVAHIAARREHGPRWDAGMSEAENRSESNLIPLCHKHSSEIDQHPERFPVELLHEWKVQQKQERLQGWQLTDAEVSQVVSGSVTTTILDSILSSNVGGIGQGGPGGPAFGEGAVGGPGGRGGDVASGTATLRTGQYQIVVGSGGKPGRPGGQSSITQIVAGELTGVQGIWAEALVLCDYASVRDGLMFVNGGGWRSFTLGNTPGTIHGYAVAVLRVHEACEYPLEENLQLDLLEPDGTVALESPIGVRFEDAGNPRRHTIAHQFFVETSIQGEWTARLALEGEELALAAFEVCAPA